MRSMTGYGKFTITEDDKEITIELKSVNNRFLEVNCRIPKYLSLCEDIVRRSLKKQISRGSVDVFFSYENRRETAKKLSVDLGLADEYYRAADTVSAKYGLHADVLARDILKFPDMLKVSEEKEDEQALSVLVEKCVTGAVLELNKLRDIEGEGIKKDLSAIISNIERTVGEVTTRVPFIIKEYRQKLEDRVKELLNGVGVDESKLLNEVAFMADKLDINEEISRLNSHIGQFKTEIESKGELGRKLDFLSQEIGREINTMGSKCNDITISGKVIYMKNELEKIKEQIRNVE